MILMYLDVKLSFKPKYITFEAKTLVYFVFD